MANTPKKVKDPTEVALSAIQEALNVEGSATNPDRGVNRQDQTPAPSRDYDDGFHAPSDLDRTSFDIDDRGPRRAANDDRETIGQLLHR